MKVSTVLALVAAGAAPVTAGVAVDWLGIEDVERVLNGENVTAVAEDVARREFTPLARLRVVETWAQDEARSSLGDRLRADEGKTYHHVRAAVLNAGRLDVGVYAHHFRAVDDAGREWKAEWGLADGFEVVRLPSGQERDGVAVFHVPLHVKLVTLRWEGDFSEAETPLAPDGAPPASGAGSEAHPAGRSAGGSGKPPPEQDPDDWDDW
ncbi:MAG TPA: hypothetical protein VHH36_01880 [Candidatus Thermoplasmatota archaeon]|nr:hypothetical protein [Candidatus Thermoplasmatota archaeon]